MACPLLWWYCGHAQYPVFAPSSSEVAVGLFLVFLYPFVCNLPQLHRPTVIFSPLWFLCILLFKMFVQVQRLQEGSQVPAYLSQRQTPAFLRKQKVSWDKANVRSSSGVFGVRNVKVLTLGSSP